MPCSLVLRLSQLLYYDISYHTLLPPFTNIPCKSRKLTSSAGSRIENAAKLSPTTGKNRTNWLLKGVVCQLQDHLDSLLTSEIAIGRVPLAKMIHFSFQWVPVLPFLLPMKAVSTDNDSEERGLDKGTKVKRIINGIGAKRRLFQAYLRPPSPPSPHAVISSALTCAFRNVAAALRVTCGVGAGEDLLLQRLHVCGLAQGLLMHVCRTMDRRTWQVIGTWFLDEGLSSLVFTACNFTHEGLMYLCRTVDRGN